MNIKNKNLLINKCYVNGAWVSSDKKIKVINPATGDLIAEVPNFGKKETINAIDSAELAFKSWSKFTAHERSKILKKWYDLVIDNQDDLATIMTAEQGKPLSEAKGEIIYAANFIEWFAEEAKRVYGDVLPDPIKDKRMITLKQPIGVCAAITPWNFPAAMITRKCAPGLAAGCTFVIKPAEQTPLTAIAFVVLAEQAGFPKGVINIITGEPEEIGKEITSNPKVRKISFTGSTAVGRILMQQSANTVKKLSLELGGNAPFIVFDDCDIDAAVEGLMLGKFRNTGQVCVSPNRIYVQEKIYDNFIKKVVEVIKKLKIGDGLKGETQLGVVNKVLNKNHKNIKIITTTLDNILRFEKSITLIKLDVEGHELQVLRGSNSILKKKPIILFEQNSWDTQNSKESAAIFLAKLGYKFIWFKKNDPIEPNSHFIKFFLYLYVILFGYKINCGFANTIPSNKSFVNIFAYHPEKLLISNDLKIDLLKYLKTIK
jgi:delta 1-pyrroline-5-carboxylate dehydrogenase